MIEVAAGCALGAVLGARHAFEPDHLAAVTTLVAEDPGARRAATFGALWGLGHAAAVLAVGVALIAIGADLPHGVVVALELAVAAMLVVLGVRAIVRRRAATAPTVVRPLAIGVVHGLAGSGALTALAVAAMSSRAAALAYIIAFAIGSIAGMAGVSGVVGASLGGVVSRPRARAALLASAGALSVVVGLAWALAIAVTSLG